MRPPRLTAAVALVMLWACGDDKDAPTGVPTEGLQVSLSAPPAGSRALLARVLEVSGADEPVRAVITIDDGAGYQRTFEPPQQGTELDLAFPGFRWHSANTVTVQLLSVPGGELVHSTDFDVSIGAPPVPFPDTMLEAGLPGGDGGDTLLPARNPRLAEEERTSYLLLADETGEVIWALESDDLWRDVRLMSDGRILALEGGSIVITDWADRSRVALSPAPDLLGYHHEVTPREGGGYWVIAARTETVGNFPLGEQQACDAGGNALLYDSTVVELDEQGDELGRWKMVDVLDTHRIGVDSMVRNADYGYDWVHLNSLQAVPGTDWIVLSARHQDAVIWLNTATGTVDHLLANEHGWDAERASLRLSPDGPIRWPFHQHAAEVVYDAATNTSRVVLFDNGNNQITPCGGASGYPVLSQVTEYEVDHTANQVRQLWSFPLGLGVYSAKMGDADRLPSGHVVGVWGSSAGDPEGTSWEAHGLGSAAGQVVEFDPATNERLWNLIVHEAERTETQTGWEVPRAQRLFSLWGDSP